MIQVGALTLARGDKELGGTVTLGEDTTYEVILSRSLTNTGEPFVYQDSIYGAEQQSTSSYFYFQDFAMSQLFGDDGVSQSMSSFEVTF